MAETWGWAGSVAEYTALPDPELIEHLAAHHLHSMAEQPSRSQLTAWKEEVAVLRAALTSLVSQAHLSGSWGVALEYELPREGGRRPDVVLLAGKSLLILEFKGDPTLSRQYLDQVDAYARDLSEYHSTSHELDVVPILVLVHGEIDQGQHYGVHITNAGGLPQMIAAHVTPSAQQTLSTNDWLAGDYAPLPSLVRAARTIFSHEPLPNIRRASSSGVDDAVEYLRDVAQQAARDGGMHLALVAGVPGAGKTLVGLRFVYETHMDEDGQDAVFLSGNGPLVKVLQHTLSKEGHEGRVFVRDVHAFLKSYGGDSSRSPHEHIWVYDEAQRAWDADKVREKRPSGFSEPEDFLRVGQKLGDWALMVGLIGEGQEIHVGEESGLRQWNEAIGDVTTAWTVHCPRRVSSVFTEASAVRIEDSLDLDVPLRAHKAERIADWVEALLKPDLAQANAIADELKLSCFSPLVTRSVEAAKQYARLRYVDAPEARFGLMMSSQRKWAAGSGFLDDFYLNPGPWFADEESSPLSCRRLEKAVTEFQCQGLELDLPIIGWGGDLLWNDGWVVPDGVRKRLQHPDQITKNVYRVLLTRGRDGFVVVVPPRTELDSVFEALLDAGCDRLEIVDLQ